MVACGEEPAPPAVDQRSLLPGEVPCGHYRLDALDEARVGIGENADVPEAERTGTEIAGWAVAGPHETLDMSDRATARRPSPSGAFFDNGQTGNGA